jgi:anaerobic magnesium-protoporphyrin IX monomethyl ester cyclase
MRIAISYPPLESDKGTPLLSQNRQFQWFKNPTYIYPVVPAQAATLLKEHGYEVLWDDGIAAEKRYGRWLADLERAGPDLVALETKTPVVKRHWRIIDDIKSRLPRAKVALLGDHVTALPQESLQNSRADFVLTGGDYDFLLLSLCQYLSGRAERLEPGIWHRQNGAITSSGPFELGHDLDSLPFIDRELSGWRLYSEKNGNFKRTPGTYIMAGRDCWHHRCTFCAWTTLYPGYRTRSPENVLDEIGALVERYGVREIMDDSGTFPVGEWLRSFCRGMVERGYHRRVTLDCNMRFGVLSFEDYRLMKQAGFRLLLFGLESANRETLERVGKDLTPQQIVESCRSARRARLYPHVTIMFGYPWETYEDALKTLEMGGELLKKGHAYTVQATVVIPYPGTPLFEECRRNGWLRTTDWERYDMKEPVMATPMEPAQVMALVQGIYRVAFEPQFLLRKLASIRDWDDVRYFARAGLKVGGHLLDFRPGGHSSRGSWGE